MCNENYENPNVNGCMDEDDPIEFLHRHRTDVFRKYTTNETLRDYYNQFNSYEAAMARIQTRIDAQKTPPPAMRSGLSLIEILAAIFILMVGIMGVIAVLPFGGYQLAKMNRADYSGNCGRAAMVKLGLSGLAENPFPIAGDASSGTQRFSAIPIIFDPKQSSGTITNQLLPVYDSFGDTCEWQDDIAYGDAVKPAITNQRPQMVGGYYGNYTWFYMLTPNTTASPTGAPPTVPYDSIHSFDVDVIVCQRRGDNERMVIADLTAAGTAGGRVTISDTQPERLDLQNTDWILITAQEAAPSTQVFAKWYRIVSKGEYDNMENNGTDYKRELMLLGPDIPQVSSPPVASDVLDSTTARAYIVEGASWVGSMTVPKKE